MTPDGGTNSNGTVFKITTTGAETVLYSFAIKGSPSAASMRSERGTRRFSSDEAARRRAPSISGVRRRNAASASCY